VKGDIILSALRYKVAGSGCQIVGPLADNAKALFGSYSATPDRQFTQTPLEGLRRLSDDTRYAAGCSDPLCSDYNATVVKQAVVRSTFVIVCLGLGICRLFPVKL